MYLVSNQKFLLGRKIPLTRDIPLQDRDTITLGHWTKINVIKK